MNAFQQRSGRDDIPLFQRLKLAKGMEKYGKRGFLLTLADIWSRGKDRAVVYNGLPKGYRTMAPINIAIAESYTCDSVDIYEDYLLTLDKDTLVMINNEYSNERS
ncbi:MAG: hypothetical protein J6L92_02550 [Clostridia bacterium]|nr:hypothetical protein [Clostridia bacterium]